MQPEASVIIDIGAKYIEIEPIQSTIFILVHRCESERKES